MAFRWTDASIFAEEKLKAYDAIVFSNTNNDVFDIEAQNVAFMRYMQAGSLPTKAKRYLQAIGNKSKNDKIDVKGLARMGLEQRLPLWQPLSKNIYRLWLLTSQIVDFNNQRIAFLNQLHALNHSNCLKSSFRFCKVRKIIFTYLLFKTVPPLYVWSRLLFQPLYIFWVYLCAIKPEENDG